MALAIEMDNRMKRKARAMGVFLNVETQRKFLKMVSNVKLQREKECLKVKADNLQNTVNVHLKYWAESDKHKDAQIKELSDENKRLRDTYEPPSARSPDGNRCDEDNSPSPSFVD